MVIIWDNFQIGIERTMYMYLSSPLEDGREISKLHNNARENEEDSIRLQEASVTVSLCVLYTGALHRIVSMFLSS